MYALDDLVQVAQHRYRHTAAGRADRDVQAEQRAIPKAGDALDDRGSVCLGFGAARAHPPHGRDEKFMGEWDSEVIDWRFEEERAGQVRQALHWRDLPGVERLKRAVELAVIDLDGRERPPEPCGDPTQACHWPSPLNVDGSHLSA